MLLTNEGIPCSSTNIVHIDTAAETQVGHHANGASGNSTNVCWVDRGEAVEG